MLKALIWALAATVAVSGAGSALAADTAAPAIPSYITAAVADAGRPAADKERDGARKPAEMLAFAGVMPGDKIIEAIPGGGYYSRILSKAVGDQGHVYELVGPPPPDSAPERAKEMAAKRNKAIEDIASNYDNVTLNRDPFTNFSIPEPADVFWTSQNYHDLNIFGTDMAGSTS
jgi:predicted methyltransferase